MTMSTTTKKRRDPIDSKKAAAPARPLRPLGDHVLIRRIDPSEKSPGGIVIPEQARKKSQEGVVVALGSGRVTEEGVRVPIDLKVGDTVVFSPHAGHDVKDDDGTALLLIQSRDVFAAIETG